MIVGVGIDVVDINRFRQALERTPSLRGRVFSDSEADMPVASLAARFAAKEALAKALGAPPGLHWHDAMVSTEKSGRPAMSLWGTVAARAGELGVRSTHVSLSHDASVASAVVVLEA